mmetsp:Transcript_265/g.578  ORF Transcript_265/g.578 Transcript_265/m.578 type:complete len:94 (-) Transcript_265:314-595(-)|eukprot:CAMPEP_0206582498 /NCGR_PEP_ID=MMETSP0325_2-20121206/34516_1 /ASSEMBLY_ACC=CAM_ASM_000347 /TAXON_ID=2866 /ORGANISM="Crypthecodinium cohnii, Strain Seligo" /LENGTH=93 /DNA_ID=CAMNT_0054089183 /DNA_START=44 /DNA_END=325 /DNA_ORIENTATION=+
MSPIIVPGEMHALTEYMETLAPQQGILVRGPNDAANIIVTSVSVSTSVLMKIDKLSAEAGLQQIVSQALKLQLPIDRTQRQRSFLFSGLHLAV